MALTVATTSPIAPASFGGGGGKQTACIMEFACKASEAFAVGDIAVLASGVADNVASDQADGAILGVCLQAKTAGGTVLFTDRIQIAAALPGAMFSGNFVGAAGTADYTANAATGIGTTGAVAYDTVAGSVAPETWLLIDSADTTAGNCRVLRYSDNQRNGKTFIFGGTVIVNPRVDFCFASSAFQPLA